MRCQHFVKFGATLGTLFSVPLGAQSAFDVTVGLSNGSGTRYVSGPALALDLTAARRFWTVGRAAISAGVRSGDIAAHLDSCEFIAGSTTTCRSPLPSQLHLSALVGVSLVRGPFEGRVLAGPLVAVGHAQGVGGELLADAAFGWQRVSVVIAGRVSALIRGQGGAIQGRAVSAGLRIRTGRQLSLQHARLQAW